MPPAIPTAAPPSSTALSPTAWTSSWRTPPPRCRRRPPRRATIPVLGTSITAYGVALDIDDFSGTVGGNVSGTSDLAPPRSAGRDDPGAGSPMTKKVGLLFYCSAEPNSRVPVRTW